MSEQVELTNPVELSVGGVGGHLFRRLFHLSMAVLPIGYYIYGEQIGEAVSLSRDKIVSVLVLTIILVEAIRLKLGLTVFGQREYESRQVSALAWGALSIGLCVLIAPKAGNWDAAYGMPLIMCLVFGDPAMGEARRMGADSKMAFYVGCATCFLVWMGAWYFLSTPLWLALLFAPLCAVAETPRLRYIDDNATMILIPLAAAIVLYPFTGL
ncbi:MAG: hypothetical protein QGH90_00260 [Candidatus Poseidoniaceae archaeon]|jgi:hypothetical protein|nr:hypothetical protein [Candidatus Poseidoniaceae archaeon]